MRSVERSELSKKPELTATIVCALPERDRGGAGEIAPLFALLGRLGGTVGATVLVGGDGSSDATGLLGASSVPRGTGPLPGALAAGAEAALARCRAEVIVFVTPELAAWRPEESALADPAALAIVARLSGAAGWRAHLDDEAPLREGLLCVAADLWRRRARSFAAAETWGDLAARIRDAGAPIFDLRALRRLAELGLSAPAATKSLASGLTRALARLAGLAQEVAPRFKLDEKRLPWLVRHGEPVPVEVSGWVALLPQASELELRIAGRSYAIPIALSRPDVLLSFPDLADDRCGFRFAAELAPLPPGIHEATLVVLPARAERALGAVRVVAKLDLACDRVLCPPTFEQQAGLPLLVDGRVVASHPPVRLEAWLDDRPIEVELAPAAAGGASDRPAEVAFRIAGRFPLLWESSAHQLLLRAYDSRGRTAVVHRTIDTSPGKGVESTVEVELGARDPRSGSCRLRARGTLFSPAVGTYVALDVDGVGVGRAPLVVATGERLTVGTFDLRLEPRLELGSHELSILLVGDGEPTLVDRRSLSIEVAKPRLAVDRVALEEERGSAMATLRAEGEIVNANLVDAVRVVFDGRQLVDVDPRSFVAAAGRADEERRRFQVAHALVVEPGRHRLRLELRRAGELLSQWEGELDSPPAERRDLQLVSADLDRLRRASPAAVWSSLALEGELRGAPAGAELSLRVDGEELERAAPSPDGRFGFVRRVEPGLHTAALEVVAGAESLARLPAFEILVRRLEIPEAWARDLDEVRAALGSAARPIDGLSSTELLRRMGEERFAELPDLTGALAEIAARAGAARERPARVVLEPPAPIERRLRVLFFSWEIPWSGHGGGVTMVNWLAHLGARHAITLVHPVHAGGEGLSEEVRDSVAEIVAVARDWHAPAQPAPFGVPASLLPTYTPALRGVIAAELGSGEFDLANVEFAGGYLHLSRGLAPSLLVHHEVGSFALAAGAPGRLADCAAASGWLRELVRALYFDTVRLPGAADHLATLTEPEARFLAPFLPGAELQLNPIPIDLAAYDRRVEEVGGAASGEPPLFVFVGTYRHAPNRDAARRLVERIAPRLFARLPGARIVLAGSELPVELAEAARAAGVDCPGYVPDLARLYAGATATLAPIDTGGGMRVKLLEAMACRCPVVTTALGMNGISARAGEEFLRAESDGEFVEAAALLAGNGALRRTLADGARAMLEREHSIAVQGERRERIWAATIAATNRAPR